MGAGYHGGFGYTNGSRERRYRFGRPVPPTERNLRMALDKDYYVQVICDKYHIHLKSGKTIIQIEIDPNLKSAGKVAKSKPYVIRLGPSAFVNESELANTIAHELNHARSFLKGGDAPEPAAYTAGDTLAEYIRGNR